LRAPDTARKTGWWHFPHEADVGLAGRAPTLPELYRQLALAMTAVVTEAEVEPALSIDIRCTGTDPELLLVDWLNALIYEMATRGMLFGDFEVAVDRSGLTARALGETVDRQRHRPVVEPKGATFTELSVQRQPDGTWIGRCVVDV
jgi:SHS2 domain-containing protein